ncbi:ribosomal large subunit pseudouridine synthase E [Neolewinella xylanilytica]|uniref:Pseudouridine synthase n=1 Tax=Neolewinella xylanilytica TaxID=1514080 RepID=A0A2S6I676_9BACT|nr:pseudouridine synthase [Neolewinella xylanilytica]PPK86678.1 ribosomal large subunit pseudouridine synthase E [Neolewinella xylanilytica]
MPHRYFLINKPYGVLSQFTREVPEHRTLADLFPFPRGVYPVGRLDRDSEGLLILTDDPRLNDRLLHPRHAHARTYWVQVEGEPGAEALEALARGPEIRIKGKVHRSQPVVVKPIAPAVPRRNPPIRERKHIADSWLQLTLTEGKNRQVRRMCAAVGFPVLRLLRYAIEGLSLEELEGEAVREVTGDWLRTKLELR